MHFERIRGCRGWRAGRFVVGSRAEQHSARFTGVQLVQGHAKKELHVADHRQICINGFAHRGKWLRGPGNDRLQGWESTT